MSELADKLAGRFIVIDGPDGAGKSTQLELLADWLRDEGAAVEHVIDPGMTNVGEKIRHILLDRDNGEIAPMCETFLFMACRAQLVYERIRPALEKGKVVLCDRFVSATLAYQGALKVDTKQIIKLGDIAIEGLWPDLTIVLDLPVEDGMKRIGIVRKRLKKEPDSSHRQPSLFGDRMEVRASGYHKKVRELFREIHKFYPRPVKYVSAKGSIEEVFNAIKDMLSEEFTASQ